MSTTYNCNEPSDQLAYASNHEVSQTTFNTYLSNFWGASAGSVTPVTKTWMELDAEMTGKDCATQCWKLEFDENDTANNDIAFGFQTLTGGTPPPYSAGITYYSIALFKGIKLDIDAVTFEFYKAIDGDDLYTVIFKAIAEDNTTKYYDLSSDY
ncbi:MAG: hypothetical protein J0L80_07415 [Chitinophagales bacterium]|nr:hypothetical protein [Chitinophagales bacterium]